LKLVSYKKNGAIRSALFVDKKIHDMQENAAAIGITLPATMLELLQMEDEGMRLANTLHAAILNSKTSLSISNAVLVAPIPNPSSCRDAYAFRQHVATARRNRGVPMIPEFDQYPVFYFTNHNAIYGEGDILVEDDHLQKLDFELEVTAIIGKKGKNISAQNADSYIAGYTIMNDLSARLLQIDEMKLNLGPAKGKDFATVIGPWLVTPNELESFKIETNSGITYNLQMEAFHNGTKISDGNMKDMNWTFAEIIERISYGTEIYPGDVIGSGTVGTGCYLELNGTKALQAKEKGETYQPVWLNEGDTIELSIESLGKLTNRIVKAPGNYSILSKKKI